MLVDLCLTDDTLIFLGDLNAKTGDDRDGYESCFGPYGFESNHGESRQPQTLVPTALYQNMKAPHFPSISRKSKVEDTVPGSYGFRGPICAYSNRGDRRNETDHVCVGGR